MEKQSTRELLSLFVWGKEPKNSEKISFILKERGVNTGRVIEEVDAIIKKHASKQSAVNNTNT